MKQFKLAVEYHAKVVGFCFFSCFLFDTLNLRAMCCVSVFLERFLRVPLLCSNFLSSVLMDHNTLQMLSMFVEFENCCYYCVCAFFFCPFLTLLKSYYDCVHAPKSYCSVICLIFGLASVLISVLQKDDVNSPHNCKPLIFFYCSLPLNIL